MLTASPKNLTTKLSLTLCGNSSPPSPVAWLMVLTPGSRDRQSSPTPTLSPANWEIKLSTKRWKYDSDLSSDLNQSNMMYDISRDGDTVQFCLD